MSSDLLPQVQVIDPHADFLPKQNCLDALRKYSNKELEWHSKKLIVRQAALMEALPSAWRRIDSGTTGIRTVFLQRIENMKVKKHKGQNDAK